MKDVSNKALAELVLLAVVVSLAGTAITLTKLSGQTGGASGLAKVNVTSAVAISLPVNVVDFGTLFQGTGDNTTDDLPPPLFLQNDGSVFANVSASGTVLFTGSGGGDNTASFQFKARENSLEPGSFNLGTSVTSFTNVKIAPIQNFISQLNFVDATDSAKIDLLINIPLDEPLGPHSSTLTFVAVQA